MRTAYIAMIVAATAAMACGCRSDFDRVAGPLKARVLELAEADLALEPVTVTASRAEKSAGGVHDFFSQADYFWPDPDNPDGPYKGRDGQSNPDNFSDHRLAMVRLSRIVGELTSAWLITGEERFAKAVEPHLRAWFIDSTSYMAPHLMYSQAVIGRSTGRSIGVIDGVHLMEVAQGVLRLSEGGAIDNEVFEGTKAWFARFVQWLTTHPYGIAEMRAANNHGTCWAMQTACFARLTGDEEVMDMCRRRFKEVFLPCQMAPDGSFPMETSRTKPYGYSLFNMDAMATLAQILSTPEDDLWEYVTPEGNCMRKGVEFITPYVEDKGRWPLRQDIMYWDEWPVAQPYLIFAWNHWKGGSSVARAPVRGRGFSAARASGGGRSSSDVRAPGGGRGSSAARASGGGCGFSAARASGGGCDSSDARVPGGGCGDEALARSGRRSSSDARVPGGGRGGDEALARRCYDAWLGLEHFPTTQEVVRNLPVRNPLIWL